MDGVESLLFRRDGVFGRWRGGEGLAYKTQTTAGLSFCVVAMVMAMVVTG